MCHYIQRYAIHDEICKVGNDLATNEGICVQGNEKDLLFAIWEEYEHSNRVHGGE
jgi:hypothetical protein